MHRASVLTSELFECRTPYLEGLFADTEFVWELLLKIKPRAEELLREGIEGYREISHGVLVGKGVKISDGAVIKGPAIIGEGCEIRPGAYIRGSVITGVGCVIGNSSELKNCILLDGVQVPHYNYVGDSVLGNRAHLGAGAICSNLKSGGSEVNIHAELEYETHLRKVGAFLGDGADVGCGCVLNPGTVIGRGSRVYPLTSVRGVYGGGCIIKSASNVVFMV